MRPAGRVFENLVSPVTKIMAYLEFIRVNN